VQPEIPSCVRQVASYAFLFPDEEGVAKRMMLPVLDMINHADGGDVNLEIMQADNGDFYAYTLRDVAKGEEACSYLASLCLEILPSTFYLECYPFRCPFSHKFLGVQKAVLCGSWSMSTTRAFIATISHSSTTALSGSMTHQG
jgi:hypothetical protein